MEASVNILFLSRLYWSFKGTLFRYSLQRLSWLFLLILLELLIFIVFSEMVFVHFPGKYNFNEINRSLLAIFFILDMVLRIAFILLFEKGLYRLATSRSLKSNLKLFGFGGHSIDKIELELSSPAKSMDEELDDIVAFKPPTTTKRQKSNDGNTNSRTVTSSNHLHPLSYQGTDRDDKPTLNSPPTIPEGDEECDDDEDDEDGNHGTFHFPDQHDVESKENDNDKDRVNVDNGSPEYAAATPSSPSLSVHSMSNSPGPPGLEIPPTIDEHGLNEQRQRARIEKVIDDALTLKISNQPGMACKAPSICTWTVAVSVHTNLWKRFRTKIGDEQINKKAIESMRANSEHTDNRLPPTMSLNMATMNNTSSNSRSHRASSSQIDDLLTMSKYCQSKRPSFAMKYLNSSTFDSHTKDLVKLVTKFSVLVVWSAILSSLAAVFFISFVVGFGDNEIVQSVNSTFISLAICFVEMHVVYLQLNGTERWYKCLCSGCHNAWGKCCVCKLRRRLVKKIGKQHKQMALRKQQSEQHEHSTTNTRTVKLRDAGSESVPV